MSLKHPTSRVREQITSLKPYVPGLSIEEIRSRYGCENVIKMASNECALGVSPLVQERIAKMASSVFRYPQGGNPRLVKALAEKHNINEKRIVVGNGSDELIDLLMRVSCNILQDNIVCCKPCFGMYTVQAKICGVQLRQAPLNEDFSIPFVELFALVDEHTKLVFITTPDNPSGYCPSLQDVLDFSEKLPSQCLLVVDEAYMDFAMDNEYGTKYSLLDSGIYRDNIAFLRTFSKSYALAGMRLGYIVLPEELADYLWRARMPFSVNILAEEAGLAALEDIVFYEKSLQVVRTGREQLTKGLKKLGCKVWPSHANFIMFAPPKGNDVATLFEALLKKGFILRPLKSYDLAHLFRITVGTEHENNNFLQTFEKILK